ncbi:cytochrome c oxidase subunit II [Thermocrinis minervae]|uniref:Cytochrome c oxidase subunit 2 n=1 Tax=Thermocrinis minervae TaxID=381751 RepID=A0A1M6RP00_9AQUI|nr:cytochrome c oxidase subunit II [Thermocrinis minervae]SHK34154.1 cytochrome c oxidase subunit 2 [Thermocrinis minervae]
MRVSRFLLLSLLVVGFASAEPLAYPANLFDNIYYIWLLVSVIIYLIVAIPMLYFMIKYRYKKGENEEGVPIHGNHALEITWTVIPLIIVIYLATQSFAFYKKQRTAPPDSMELKVTGFMWGWEVDYPNGKKVFAFFNDKYQIPEEQKIVIPAGKPVKVLLTSRDVIHSFYVRPAKVMEDAVPGRITHLWFQINKPGEYWVFCREYCGTQHSRMVAILKVVPQAEFDKWVNQGVSNQKSL